MGKNKQLCSTLLKVILDFITLVWIVFLEKCSHVRAHHLFLESLSNPFPAIQCESHEEIYKRNQCTSNNIVAMMGGDITPYTPRAYGIVWLNNRTKKKQNSDNEWKKLQHTPKFYSPISGIFYLETNGQPPFSKFDHRNFNRIKIIPYQHWES